MKWGRFEIHLVSDGYLWLDGGAMFGVVPKVLWERKTLTDEKNRIRLATNCLLIRGEGKNILVDTGCGQKYTEKEIQIYRIEHPTDLLAGLRNHGMGPEDIDLVVNTHYHFDHCGGNTRREGGEVVPTFPRATYLVRREEYEAASHPNERSAASYFPHNWEPLERKGQLQLLDRDERILPGLTLVHTPGHTAGHQSVKIESGEGVFFYIADLCPTAAHAPLPWIMAFDLYPLTTLEVRKKIYGQALRENWLLFFEHDPEIRAGYLKEIEGRFMVQPVSWSCC